MPINSAPLALIRCHRTSVWKVSGVSREDLEPLTTKSAQYLPGADPGGGRWGARTEFHHSICTIQ